MERELASRANHRVVRLFGHADRKPEYRMVRRVLIVAVSRGLVGVDRG